MTAERQPTQATARRVAWAGMGLGAAMASFELALVLPGASPLEWVAALMGDMSAPAALAGAVIGALVLHRRPRNAVGWVLLAAGLGFVATSTFEAYALADPPLPGRVAAAWLASWQWSAPFALYVFVLPLVFPDGRLPSRRWRPVLGLAVTVPLVQMLAIAMAPGPLVVGDTTVAPNPLGVDWVGALQGAVDVVVVVTFVAMLVAALTAVLVRYRDGTETRRRQVRWFLLAVALTTAAFPFTAIPAVGAVVEVAGGPLSLMLPGAVAIAILRHRLYDIDRLVSRTVGYALLTALLAGVYVGGVMVLTPALVGVAGDTDLPVAVATLAVAALFRPARRRIQARVDRRFDRAGYDAQRTIARFRDGLRQEIDSEQVRVELVATAVGAMAPSRCGVWFDTPPKEAELGDVAARAQIAAALADGRGNRVVRS